MASGVVFQSLKAKSEDQDLSGHQRQRCVDSNMDGADCHIGTKVLADDVYLCVVLVKFGCFIAAAIIRVSRSVDLA